MNKRFTTHSVLILLMVSMLCTSTGCKDVAASTPQEAPAEKVAAAAPSSQPPKALPTITGNPNAVVGKYGQTRLHIAAKNGNALLVEALLLAGADVNSLDVSGFSPLLYACADDKSHTEVVKLLIKNGADVTGTASMTPLSSASSNGHTEIVKLLRAAGATH